MTESEKEALRKEFNTFMGENWPLRGKSLEDTFFDFLVSKLEEKDKGINAQKYYIDSCDALIMKQNMDLEQSEAKLEAARKVIDLQSDIQSTMKEPLTLQQSKDEVAKAGGREDGWNADFEFKLNFTSYKILIERAHAIHLRSFIDSLRGKIEEKISEQERVIGDSEDGIALSNAHSCYSGMNVILTLLNETK
jgi:hypothetical protein